MGQEPGSGPIRLHYDAEGGARLGVFSGVAKRSWTASAVSLLNVAFERGTPEVMSVAGRQVIRRGVHNEEFLAHRTLPGNAAKLAEECVVMSHDRSIERGAPPRNLLW